MNRITVVLMLLFASITGLMAQDIPNPVANTGVYDFIDELSNIGIIEINSAIKPYSRSYISERLREADGRRDELTARQRKELDFYLRDFGKEYYHGKDWDRRMDMFYYDDSLFTITVNPILGGSFSINENGTASYWRNGIEAWSYIGKWSFWASLRDNHAKPMLGQPEYLTQLEGGHVKNSTDWSEMQAGVAYAWKWGSAGLVKDGLQWGNGYNGANIFSGHSPTFFQFRLHMNPVEWFDFNYFHGSLNSMVVDSSRSYWVNNSYGTDYREVYHTKFIAANMFSFRPARGLWISAGNSIIYDSRTFNPVYLIPVAFFKSIDHSVSSGIDNMNSQLFFDISSRQVKHLHLYGTMFIDELSVSRFTEPDEYNFFSYKAGFRLSDLPFDNLGITAEYTFSYPLTFQHYVPTLTFESNNYNLGHWLRDNSREWYFAIDYRPIRASYIRLFFTDAVRGPDYTSLGGDRIGNPPLETVEWHSTSFGLMASYQLVNDLYFSFSFVHSNITGVEEWTAPYFYGTTNTVSGGMTVGF